MSLFTKAKRLINQGQERSVKAKKNILAAFIIKGFSIAASLLIVPLTIDYVNPSKYGIWLTLSSVVGWFAFFDIGLTQGLRNKFAEAKAKGQTELAQSYVSTTYAILAIIFFCVWLLFILANNFLNWADILKLPAESARELSLLALIIFTYFCLQFVLRVITTLIIADQQPAKSALIDVLGQVVSLLVIFVLVKTTKGSLILLGLGLCISPLLVLTGANWYFFKGSFKTYRPSLTKVRFSYAKGLLNLGIIFFIIQVAGIVQYQTANFIIARNFAPSDVTDYNIVYKYFGILNMISLTFLTPFWSASTEAYFKKDINWIRKAVQKYNLLNLGLLCLGFIMLLFSSIVYDIWIGDDKININFYLSFWGFMYFIITMFSSTYVSFLNGINALRIQFLACILSPFLYVGISLLLIQKFKMGVYALFIASIIANFNGYILSPLQYHMVINKNKKGIWIK